MRPSLRFSDSQPKDDASLDELLREAAAGDDQAWRRLIGLYSRRVYALVRSRVGDPDLAEELTQSVFATVSTKLADQYTEQGRFESWLFRIAMNRVRDEARRAKRQATAVDPVVFDARAGQPATGRDEDLTARLGAAMGELSDADREIIELRHHGQMSFKQMAELLDEPTGTLLARHHRALRKLRSSMEDRVES